MICSRASTAARSWAASTAASTAASPAAALAEPFRKRLVKALLIGSLLASGIGASMGADSDVGFEPPAGAPFFLLSDASYSSADEARVRLQMTGDRLAQFGDADGVDIALYRVSKPLDFLRQQRDLHRIDLKAAARSEGLANTLSYLWDQWWLRARQGWQNLFDSKARVAVTDKVPALKTSPDIAKPTRFAYASPYRAIAGMTEVDRMRYPIASARPIEPPKDLKLAGSSSEFTAPQDGNIYIPLGRHEPGLYVVEAAAGRHRAVTLLFVSDTMAVAKTARDQLFMWTARRDSGKPSATHIVWSDLNGVLGEGDSDENGVLRIDHSVPQTSYAFGSDAQGGVFVTENFYYDSEIDNAKLYAYTDRPLYRPGDEVNIRVYAREFASAVRSTPLAATSLDLTVLDATGTPVHHEVLSYHPQEGAAARFTLPTLAPAGGYDIRIRRGDDLYGAAFRVAPYVKPHYEIVVDPAKPGFKTGEPITGSIRLAYYDGQPVRNAQVDLSARAQQLTMVEGDLIYGGAFPLQLDNNHTYTTDGDGRVTFTLPAAREPSRVLLAVSASDGAAQRVRTTRELLVERAAASWRLTPQRQFGSAGERIEWQLQAQPGQAYFDPEAPGAVAAGGAPAAGGGNAPSAAAGGASAPAAAGAATSAPAPTHWVAIHQATQTKTDGRIENASRFELALGKPGAYTIEARDDENRLLGAAPFWVSGGDDKPPPGAVEIVLDHPAYHAGDTARALITFPLAVDDALVTIERDRVEAWGRLVAPNNVAKIRRVNDRQWEALIVVDGSYAPNVTLSVAYLKGGEFGFQNAGIVVEHTALQVEVKTDRPRYAPGENVDITLATRDAAGKAVAAVLSVGVVDEMVYALQPELAPTVQAFFHPLRRDNVRTQSSQSFISFDEAIDARNPASISRQRNSRGVKMLERPRRDERDTALFAPVVRTDAQGVGHVSFKMPDSLTRWRITAKGYGVDAADGLMGERRATVVSDQPFFARWTSPDWARLGDTPQASIALFNQTPQATRLTMRVEGAGATAQTRTIDAKPGANFVTVDLPAVAGDSDLRIELRDGDRVVDALATTLHARTVGWRSEREVLVPLASGERSTTLALPADADDVKVRVLAAGEAQWSRIADALIEDPYGCVEQTASRIVPLAYSLLAGSTASPNPALAPARAATLRTRLYNARLRLVAMAGPEAVFGWWGHGTTDDAFLTAYAYYADFLATRALGIDLEASNWEKMLDVYAKNAKTDSVTRQTWILWLMQQMKLPVATQTDGLLARWQRETTAAATAGSAPATATTAVAAGSSPLVTNDTARDVALALAAQLAASQRKAWPGTLDAPLSAAQARLASSSALLPQAVLVAGARRSAAPDALADALARSSVADPTIERALALALLATPSAVAGSSSSDDLRPAGDWREQASASGRSEFVATPKVAHLPIEWSAAATMPQTVSARFTSAEPLAAPSLQASVTRALYRVIGDGDHYRLEAVKAGEPLSLQSLYLDEVTIQAREKIDFALLELGLPPGATLETTTWGINLPDADGKPQPLERAVGEVAPGRYSVPIDTLNAGQSVTRRHLIRVAQPGEFSVPAARLWLMYQATRQAVETGPATRRWKVS